MAQTTVVDGATSAGTHDVKISGKRNTASLNVLFTSASPTATVALRSRNAAAQAAGESEAYTPVSGAEFTGSTEDTITGLTAGEYQVVITGTVSAPIYVTIAR